MPTLSLLSEYKPPLKSTKTKVLKKTVEIPLGLITPTANVKKSKMRSPVPICVFKYGKKFIILDGNHRFCYAKKTGKEFIQAWIITGRDRSLILGKTTGFIQEWRDRKISFKELREIGIRFARLVRTLKKEE